MTVAHIPLVYADPTGFAHDTGPGHPEHGGRLRAVMATLDVLAAEGRARVATAGPVDDELLGLVHPAAYVELVGRHSASGEPLDADTVVSDGSELAARMSAGMAAAAATAVMQGASGAFVAARPPGHHAKRALAGGFCLFNNVAVAREAARRAGAHRVAVIDFDVHHGNGTQAIFESDPSTLMISSHQLPGWPGSGRATELGIGAGLGATLNCPLPPGTGDGPLEAFYGAVVPRVLDAFAPDLILVSAGFDLMAGDPLGGFDVSLAGVQAIAAHLVAAADRLCGGRVVAVLEGGYDLDNLSGGVQALVDAMARRESAPIAALDPNRLGPAAAHLGAWRTAFTI
jgi:acetoin utilization deacetylase AcuC-like enzyme